MKDFLDKFDVILDANDPDIAKKFAEAVGLEPGGAIQFITPQFTRTDGITPSIPLMDFSDLPAQSGEALKAMGCRPWDEPNDKGETLWLFPGDWYAIIPDGTPIVDINYGRELFKRGETDDDIRYGCLSFGFLSFNGPVGGPRHD